MKLTLKQIDSKITEIESRYHKGHKQGEEWWRLSGQVHPVDRGLWVRYQNLRSKRLKEASDEGQ